MIVLSYFFPGDCSYEGPVDVASQHNDSKMSVGELQLTFLNSNGFVFTYVGPIYFKQTKFLGTLSTFANV